MHGIKEKNTTPHRDPTINNILIIFNNATKPGIGSPKTHHPGSHISWQMHTAPDRVFALKV